MQVNTRCPRCAPSAWLRPTVLKPLQNIQFYLGFKISVQLNFVRQQAGFFGYLRDGFEHCRLRDVNVRGDRLRQRQRRGAKTTQTRFLFERGHIAPLFTAQ